MESKTKIKQITYFGNAGNENTMETLRLAKQRADELGIKTILVASTLGDTGMKATEIFKGNQVIVISHSHGFAAPNKQEMSPENRSIIEANNGVVLTATHAFAGVPRAIRRKFNTYQTSEIIAYTLRILGEGIKVTCEIVMMAADAGLLKTSKDVIAIAGTGNGADTAAVIKPANTQDFFDLRIREIICKPRL